MAHIMVIGATGLVGTQVLSLAITDSRIHTITTLGRSPLNVSHSKLTHHLVDFNALTNYNHLFKGVTHVICCIGTTIKKAKTKEQFKWVDAHIPTTIATIAKDNSVPYFSLVSSIGANPNATSFYLNVKGNLEQTLINMQWPQLFIYRPSLLIGTRSDFRLGERMAIACMPFIKWLIPTTYKPTHATILAEHIIHNISNATQGTHIVESKELLIPPCKT